MIHVLKTIQIVPRGYTDIHGSHQTVYMPQYLCMCGIRFESHDCNSYISLLEEKWPDESLGRTVSCKQGCYEAWTRFSVLLDLLKQQQRT